MTATRPGGPDEYFTSRMNFALGLPRLDFGFQQEIWRDVIKSLNLSSPQLEHFISVDLVKLDRDMARNMNGRQIQACLRAALALAKQKGEDLTGDQIQRVLQLAKEFKDFFETRQSVEPTQAVFQEWREGEHQRES